MPRDGHDIGCAIGKRDATSGGADLQHVPRKIAGRMHHRLMLGRDVATGRVIVEAKVQPAAAATRGFEQFWDREGA